jgi:V/A-type H+-transporting ATPase subunit I
MAKVRALCLKQVAPSVIKELHNLSAVELKDASLPQMQRSGPLISYDEISSRLIRIRSMREALGKNGKTPRRKVEIGKPLQEADSLLSEQEKLLSMLSERDSISKELDSLLAQKKSLLEISGLHMDFSQLSSPSLQFILLKAPDGKSGSLAHLLSNRKNTSFQEARSKGSTVFLIALPKKEDPRFLEAYGSTFQFPSLSSTPQKEIASLVEKEEGIRMKQEACGRKLQHFSDSHYPRLVAVEEELSIQADRARAASQFGATESLYLIEGWVQDAQYAALEASLKGKFGKKILVSKAGLSHDEAPPTLLSNPKRAQPFQFLVEFISLPQYSEIDPTIFLTIIIPLMYALIFGDALYAALSFVVSYLIVSKSKEGSILKPVATIWMLSSIPAFFVGIAFDEYFGFTHTHLLEKLGMGHIVLYEGFHRLHNIETLMLLSIIIGVLHIGLGLLLGAINEWNHSKKHAIAKLSWIGIELSGFFLVAIFMFNSFTFLSLPAMALFAISVAVLLWSEGPIGLIEIPGLASNIVSYVRIAAVGVGGVIIAEAINELLFPKFDASPLGVAAFILTAAFYLAIHLASCIIAMFE